MDASLTPPASSAVRVNKESSPDRHRVQFGILTSAEVAAVMDRKPSVQKILSNGVSLLGPQDARMTIQHPNSKGDKTPGEGRGESRQRPSNSSPNGKPNFGTLLVHEPEASTSKSNYVALNGRPSVKARTFSSTGSATRPSSAASKVLSLKPTNEALAITRSRRSRKTHHSHLPLVDAPPLNPQAAPAVSFSSALRPPPSAGIPEIHPAHGKSAPPLEPTSLATIEQDGQLQQEPEKESTIDIVKETPKPSPTKSATASPTKSALKPRSWADLLRSSNASTTPKRVSIALPPDSPAATEDVFTVAKPISAPSTSKPKADTLEDLLSNVEWQQKAPVVQPRGMINQGNMCFENSILQVLVFCAPFYNLMQKLSQHLPHDLAGRTRLLEATVALVQGYKPVSKLDLATPHDRGEPFVPEGIYDALRQNKRFSVMQQGQQEDAQEFLGYYLETLHEELCVALDRHSKKDEPQFNGDGGSAAEGWLEVGLKGRTATTRKAEGVSSPLSRIFGGLQRSLLHAPGQKDSATVEPFMTLQLDVEASNVETIEDALNNLTTPETLSDFVVQGGLRVEATKQLFLEELPPVLVLHLKRFSYNNVGGIQKNHKIVGYGLELDIKPTLLSAGQRSSKPIKYHLTGVVYHHGRSATGGHYTASLLQQTGQWLNVDDTVITPVSPADVAVNRVEEVLRLSLPSSGAFQGLPDRSAYLLFYSRSR